MEFTDDVGYNELSVFNVFHLMLQALYEELLQLDTGLIRPDNLMYLIDQQQIPKIKSYNTNVTTGTGSAVTGKPQNQQIVSLDTPSDQPELSMLSYTCTWHETTLLNALKRI